MNILHTETLKKWGGQQNRVLSEAVGLKQRKHKVIIACHKGSVLARKSHEAGLKVYEVNMLKQAHLATIPRLIHIIKKENIDIVSTHSSVDSWAGGLAAKLSGRRLVRFRHNLFPIGKDPLTKLIYFLPDRIIAISNTVASVLKECGMNSGKLSTIPDSVDPEIFAPEVTDIREELNIADDTIVIGNTSTFTQVKGQEDFLKAFNRIREKINCILLFAGRLIEPSKSRYLSYVNKKYRDDVIFLGHRDDIPRVLNTIDIFVYPSILEGLGTALLEAMIMGRPVAVSDIPTFKDFISDKINGVYFRTGDPESIAEAVIMLIENVPLREEIGSSARTTALDRFALDRMIDLTEACYLEVIDAE